MGASKYFNFLGDSRKKVRTINEVVEKLSNILDINDELLLAKFNNNGSGVQLLDQITEEEAKRSGDLV